MATFACVLSLILKAETQHFTCMYLLIYWVKWMTCWVKSHVWVIKCSRFTERIQMAQCGQQKTKMAPSLIELFVFQGRFYFCWMTADRIYIDWRFWGLTPAVTPPTKPWMSQKPKLMVWDRGWPKYIQKFIYLKYLTLHVVVGDILLCLIWRLCSCDVAVMKAYHLQLKNRWFSTIQTSFYLYFAWKKKPIIDERLKIRCSCYLTVWKLQRTNRKFFTEL